MNFLLNLFAWLIILPWWGKLALVGGLALFILGAAWWVKYQFNKITFEAVRDAGAALAGANVEVHSIRPVEAPRGPSAHDAQPGDEDFAEGIDDQEWDEPGVAFYELDATIAPADLEAAWNPATLAQVPAGWKGESEIDVCENTGCVHTAHVYRGGGWVPVPEDDVVVGKQRVKLLFGFQPDGVKAIQLRMVVTNFGEPFALPVPLPRVVGSR